MAPFRLSVLDFCAASDGKTPADAPWETIELVQQAESFGYARFWLTEHHSLHVGHCSPEVLLPALAGVTRRIRVGSGGVLLRYYSPLKVACNFRLLQALFPGRIDLGLAGGRALEPERVRLLLDGQPAGRDYEEKVAELLDILRGRSEVPAVPVAVWPPDEWLLGQGRAMALAARHGTSFCLDRFIRPGAEEPSLTKEYQQRFQPGETLDRPRWAVAVAGLCAETEEEARRQVARAGELSCVPTVVGSPAQCRRALEQLSDVYETADFVFHDVSRDLATRVTSYRLLAEAMGLSAEGY